MTKGTQKFRSCGNRDTVIEMFKSGQLDIDPDVAISIAGYCKEFRQHKHNCKGVLCSRIHVKGSGELSPTLGLLHAADLVYERPTTTEVYVNPCLALQGYLLSKGSNLVVEKWWLRDGNYVFKFVKQKHKPHVLQIARQGWVNVATNHSKNGYHHIVEDAGIARPTHCVHGVQYFSLENALSMLVNGVDYGEAGGDLFGLYTVRATDEMQVYKMRSYDGGAALLFEPEGFMFDLSRKRERDMTWLIGAIGGVTLHRPKENTKMRELIVHRDSVIVSMFAIVKEEWDAWKHTWAQTNRKWIQEAVLVRRRLNSRLDPDTIAPSSWPSEGSYSALVQQASKGTGIARKFSPMLESQGSSGGYATKRAKRDNSSSSSQDIIVDLTSEVSDGSALPHQAGSTCKSSSLYTHNDGPSFRASVALGLGVHSADGTSEVLPSMALHHTLTGRDGDSRQVAQNTAPNNVGNTLTKSSAVGDKWTCDGPSCQNLVWGKKDCQKQHFRLADVIYYYCFPCWNEGNHA